jgi:hypothetical protein
MSKDLDETRDGLTEAITKTTPADLNDFFSREQAIGSLYQVNLMRSWAKNYRNDIQEQIDHIS